MDYSTYCGVPKIGLANFLSLKIGVSKNQGKLKNGGGVSQVCLIIIKPPNMEFPTEDILFRAFKENPDGAGIAFNLNNNIYIHKGYMTYKHFIEAYNEIVTSIAYLKGSTVVFHFRRASRGGVHPDLTHPFPISSDMDTLTQHFCKTEYAVFHNGTIKLMDKAIKKNRKLSYETYCLLITDVV